MIAFINVNVIPMDTERVLENQTVIVENDRITAIGPTDKVVLRSGTKIIDGNGAFLVPGLADMHMHVESIERTFEGPELLRIYLAEGVTTIRNLSAMPEHLVWAQEIARGERPGPSLYNGRLVAGLPDDLHANAIFFRAVIVLSPLVIGLTVWLLLWILLNYIIGNQALYQLIQPYLLPSLGALLLAGGFAAWRKIIPLNAFTSRRFPFVTFAESAAESRRFVQEIKAAGYDFVKSYDYLPPDAYLAALDEARKQHIYTVGHLLDELAQEIETIFRTGLREVAHIDEFTDRHMLGRNFPNKGFSGVTFDYSTIPQTASILKEQDVMVVSNLVADEVIYCILEDLQILSHPIYAVVPPQVLDRWRSRGRFINWQGQQEWRRNVQMPFLMTLTKALHDAGVPLLIGTDLSVEGMIPVHVHRDLELLVEAGLSPFEALAAGTRNAGISVERMDGNGCFGTIKIGQRADLLLLKGNPLENISATRSRVGVMVRGQWFTQAELDAQTTRADAPGAAGRK
jgi:hypothetical protein